MTQKELNSREEQLNDFGGGGGAHKPADGTKQESRDYGKWALVDTAVVLVAAAVVLLVISAYILIF